MANKNYHKSFSFNNGEIFYIDQIKDKINIDSNVQSNNISESVLLSNNGFIGNNEALKMFNRYFEVGVKPFRKSISFDTKAVWHSIEEIRNYINYM